MFSAELKASVTYGELYDSSEDKSKCELLNKSNRGDDD